MFFKKKFPNDEIGNTLSQLYQNGVNFKIKHHICFYIQFNDSNCEGLLLGLKQKGFDAKLIEKEEKIKYIAYTKWMILDYEDLVQIKKILVKIVEPLGGIFNTWELI